jgi:preprotein translocase subunit YajC
LILQFLADAATQPSTGAPPPPWYFSPGQFMVPLVFAVLMLFLLNSNKNKKVDRNQTDLLKNLKRGDRVMTIGGILGTIVDAKETEVTLKVDESSNTKVKFTRDAIKRVIGEEDTSASK